MEPKGIKMEPKGAKRVPKGSKMVTKMHPKIDARREPASDDFGPFWVHFWSQNRKKTPSENHLKTDAEKIEKMRRKRS